MEAKIANEDRLSGKYLRHYEHDLEVDDECLREERPFHLLSVRYPSFDAAAHTAGRLEGKHIRQSTQEVHRVGSERGLLPD